VKAGILNEPAVMISSLRRPADVLIDDLSNRLDKMALDVKVINALGQNHLQQTLASPLEAADAYRLRAMELQDTASRCAQRGVRFEPMVFTCQGGIQTNAEGILALLAESVAKIEGSEPSIVKADIIRDLSRTLVRAAARAIARRSQKYDVPNACGRIVEAATILEE
jgi:hypothetical protein